MDIRLRLALRGKSAISLRFSKSQQWHPIEKNVCRHAVVPSSTQPWGKPVVSATLRYRLVNSWNRKLGDWQVSQGILPARIGVNNRPIRLRNRNSESLSAGTRCGIPQACRAAVLVAIGHIAVDSILICGVERHAWLWLDRT